MDIVNTIVIILIPLLVSIIVFFIASYLSGYWHLWKKRLREPYYVGLVFILRKSENEKRIVLIKKRTTEPYIGSFVLPGGAIEKGLKGNINGIMRQIAEKGAEEYLGVDLVTRQVLLNGERISLEASLGFRPAYLYVYEGVVTKGEIREGVFEDGRHIKFWDINDVMRSNEVPLTVKEIIKKACSILG